MYRRRSSRPPKAPKKSPQRSPSPNEEVIRRRFRGKRQRTGLRKAEAGDSVVDADGGMGRDIIDIIDSTRDTKRVTEEDEVKFVEVADKGVDESDEDSASVASSIASGPSLLRSATPQKARPSQGLCSACRTLYQRAIKTKAPIKNKLLDNDPKSLTCDQWVLIKQCRPRRLPNARGKLLMHVQLVKKRLKAKSSAKRCVGEGESPACSRPHTFLQRNLRRCVRVPAKKEKKKNRRKRKRDDSQGPRAAKQQRLHGNNRLHPARGHGSSPDLVGRTDQEMDDPADKDLTVELIPSPVTVETAKQREAPPRRDTPKKRGGFRDLLAQLRGNSSMIVRETR